MKLIEMDASGWTSPEDFYRTFLPLVGAPDWHGHNLDALNDSIGAGEINQIELPYRIVIRGCSNASPNVQAWIERFRVLVVDLVNEGKAIELMTS